MPLGFERLNERTHRPNSLINFIRPLPGPTSTTAESILNRVAAICYPFMKKHTILVQALEEFPSNNEFVGRNFNAGEVIQLVLRNKRGQWLPERWVMMVMVHELAHCKQMNHSKAFWKLRDDYAKDLRDLWGIGYTGEGLWGRGRSLENGEVQVGSVVVGDVPEHLCGGTYRRRRKRRRGGKTKEELTYAERKERRVLKKFGAGGQALGADEGEKVKLEGGVAKKGKPRVAGSARGRELRAAAALARFDTAKKEEVPIKDEEVSESETDDTGEDAGTNEAAIDVDGKKMTDDRGRALIKICDDEDDRDENARRELDEIQEIGLDTARVAPNINYQNENEGSKKLSPAEPSSSGQGIHIDGVFKRRPEPNTAKLKSSSTSSARDLTSCAICSFENERGSLTCAVCSNVLITDLVPDHWKCCSQTCKDSQYINSADASLCGVCGSPRQTT